jgi:hypothetical protein
MTCSILIAAGSFAVIATLLVKSGFIDYLRDLGNRRY